MKELDKRNIYEGDEGEEDEEAGFVVVRNAITVNNKHRMTMIS